MRQNKTISTILVFLGGTLSLPHWADAGSNSGSTSSAIGFSCDNRASFLKSFDSWCTNVNANIIKNKCVVAVHLKDPIQNCGWQGCGFVSFVNERPVLKGTDVVEYGIATPSGVVNLPAEWEFNNGSVMPKSPFPRHYLTVDQFFGERAKCSKLSVRDLEKERASGSALGKICSINPVSMALNPYYFCMLQQGVIPR